MSRSRLFFYKFLQKTGGLAGPVITVFDHQLAEPKTRSVGRSAVHRKGITQVAIPVGQLVLEKGENG